MVDMKQSTTYTRDRETVISLTQKLVQIESVFRNDGKGNEQEVANYVAEYLRNLNLGIEVHMEEVTPGRPNVIGIIDSKNPVKPFYLKGIPMWLQKETGMHGHMTHSVLKSLMGVCMVAGRMIQKGTWHA